MFILNKKGIKIVYDSVMRNGYKVRIINDEWQFINSIGDIFPLSETILINYGLGIDPNKIK